MVLRCGDYLVCHCCALSLEDEIREYERGEQGKEAGMKRKLEHHTEVKVLFMLLLFSIDEDI